MAYSENRKRKFQDYGHQRQNYDHQKQNYGYQRQNSYEHQRHADSYNKRTRFHEKSKHPIIEQVQAQRGIRGQLVLFESNLDMPFTVLQNAVDRINGTLICHTVEKTNEGNKYKLEVNNEILAEGLYENIAAAKRNLAELAITELRKNCFTIFRKVHPRESPKVDLSASSSSDNTGTNLPSEVPAVSNMKGIGAKMMLQMGWSGGGLGAEGQGRTSIIQPYIQIQRQGLGTKNIVQEVKKVLQDYATSRDINSVAFSPDFTKEERVVIHEVARKLNLKSRSYGKSDDRILVVQSKVKPWDLIYSLLDAGGGNDQLQLISPTEFKKNT